MSAKYKILFFVSLFVFGLTMSFSSVTRAASISSYGAFGAFSLVQVPCTCEAGALWWAPLAPFYNPSVPMTGALVYVPGSFAFNYHTLHPYDWIIGFYVPGMVSCQIGSPPFCVQLPNQGLITPITATSP